MIEIDVPGWKKLCLKHLVLDYNGTLACDGQLLHGVAERLIVLANHLKILVVTADTFGKAAGRLMGLPLQLRVLPEGAQDGAKQAQVKKLGSRSVVAIGNGRNDRLMLREAALGIVVIQQEGAAAEALAGADIICTDILAALDLLKKPLRLAASLRV